MKPPNLLQSLPACLPDEAVDVLARGEGVRIERIVSRGQSSPEGFWYDQNEDEWVLVLSGAASLRFADGRLLQLGPGDHVDIRAGQRHRIEWTTPDMPTVWLAVFYRPLPQESTGAR